MGLGRADLTFSLLGQKYGSPWIYAALERGLEAFPGQATVFELDETYSCREIDKHTVFIAIAGFGETQTITTRVLNAAFKQIGANVRCLPIELGDVKMLKKMLDVLKVKAILVSEGNGKRLLPLAEHIDKHDAQSEYIDLLLRLDDGWHGYNTLWRSGLKALENSLGGDAKRPLERHNVLVLGNGGMAQSMVYGVAHRKGMVSICGPNDKESQQIASTNECRMVPYAKLYETLADVERITRFWMSLIHRVNTRCLSKHANAVVRSWNHRRSSSTSSTPSSRPSPVGTFRLRRSFKG